MYIIEAKEKKKKKTPPVFFLSSLSSLKRNKQTGNVSPSPFFLPLPFLSFLPKTKNWKIEKEGKERKKEIKRKGIGGGDVCCVRKFFFLSFFYSFFFLFFLFLFLLFSFSPPRLCMYVCCTIVQLQFK